MTSELKPAGCICPVIEKRVGVKEIAPILGCPIHHGSTFKSTHGAGQDIGDSFGRGMDLPERDHG